MSASFHREEEGFAHQTAMPVAPPPEDEHVGWFSRYVEVRPVPPPVVNGRPYQLWWFRARGVPPDDPLSHVRATAYASDMRLIGTALLPHIDKKPGTGALASLDHAMWFHRPFRADE